MNALAVLSICICFIVKKEKKEIYDGGVARVLRVLRVEELYITACRTFGAEMFTGMFFATPEPCSTPSKYKKCECFNFGAYHNVFLPSRLFVQLTKSRMKSSASS